ncbi:MAG: M50 family metallopeptidase [Gaiellaceae bacterium]|jgi:regulator of sigma E protease
MNVSIAILGLALLILVHEAGHFFTARAVGMSPRRFYLGFPPALVKVKRSGIEYGIGAIPLGGYVKIPGMHRPAPSDLDVHLGRARHEAPELGGVIEQIKRLVSEGEMAEARARLTELERAVRDAELSPAAAKAAERGLTELRDALGPDAYWRQRTWRKVAVIFAGPGTNLVFAILLIAVVYMVGVPSEASRQVDRVDANSPAQAAGLRPDDVIVAVNGERAQDFDELSQLIRGSKGKPIRVTVKRGNRVVVLEPEATKLSSDGRWVFGFRPDVVYKRYGPLESLELSVRESWRVTEAIGGSLGRIVTGEGRDEISSPVGIVDASSQVIDEGGFRLYLRILAFISLSLAILNLLPLLPLDGGHIAFSLVEGLRGRAVGREIYERVSAVGIALVLILFFVGLTNDIGGGVD